MLEISSSFSEARMAASRTLLVVFPSTDWATVKGYCLGLSSLLQTFRHQVFYQVSRETFAESAVNAPVAMVR
jgi:hypothetical protein